MNIFDQIPDEDKTCLNCMSAQCGKCLNHREGNTEDNFTPDDGYLQNKFGCKSCDSYNDGEYSFQCYECSRYHSDLWERM